MEVKNFIFETSNRQNNFYLFTSTTTYRANPIFFAGARERTDAGKKIRVSSYAFGFNGKESDDEVKGNGDQLDYGMRIYDPRLGRFLSVDPLFKRYPWNGTYTFAENDVISSIDLEGGEKLRITNVNTQKRSATLTIVKDIEIISNNCHPDFKNINSQTIKSTFATGNTTLYVKSLPENGHNVKFISKRKYDKGKGYKLNVEYDVNTKYVNSPTPDFSGQTSTVVSPKKSTSFTSNTAPAKGDASDGIQVALNPNFGYKNLGLTPGTNGVLTPEEVIIHEVGFHNMEHLEHRSDSQGNAIYPSTKGLESNVNGLIAPTDQDTKQIIRSNAKKGRVERKN